MLRNTKYNHYTITNHYFYFLKCISENQEIYEKWKSGSQKTYFWIVKIAFPKEENEKFLGCCRGEVNSVLKKKWVVKTEDLFFDCK